MRLEFRKMSGAGNDFVVVDNRKGVVGQDKAGLARRLCDRHWGIGADGLLLVEESERADYRMEYFNADGSHGGMCGNGGRCIAAYAVDRGIANALHRFEALHHVYKAEVRGTETVLWMRDPGDLRMNIVLRVAGSEVRAHFLDTGAPHVVIHVTGDLEKADVEGLGRLVRNHPEFGPNGTNVNFLKVLDDKSVQIRTFERGVEAETLACGTGSVASAIIASATGGVRPPVSVTVRSGAKLLVDFDEQRDGKVVNVRLSGPVTSVFEGWIDL